MQLVGTVFSGLSALVVEDVQDTGEMILVRARTPGRAVACPACGAETVRVHGYHERIVADVPVDGRRVLVRVRVRRMRCPVPGCPRQTFREQVPGVVDRYQRRTSRLTGQVSAVTRGLAGRAGARQLPALGIAVSRDTALRVLLRISLPAAGTPRVLGTTSRCAAATATPPCSSTPRLASVSTSCPAAPLMLPRPGCAAITAEGIRILASPPQAPRANAICERIIGTLRHEVFDRLLIVHEHHLRRLLTEYLRHYNTARPHRALSQLAPAQAETRPPEPINLAEHQIRRK
jgi:transposase InsO family protein